MSLKTQQLVKVYGEKTVVCGVDISLNRGEIVGLLGPNGAGKTTSFYMIVGLIKASNGSILLEDRDITTLPMHKRAKLGIGYLPQEASVFRKLTVRNNLLAVAETLNLNRSQQRLLVDTQLDKMNLRSLSRQKAFTLSGGERRRLEIARALLLNPKFLLLDEPFSGVDPISVSELQTMIRSLKEQNIGILITDHNIRETLRIVDRAYLIYQGKVLSSGTSEFLVQDPASRKFYLGEHFQL